MERGVRGVAFWGGWGGGGVGGGRGVVWCEMGWEGGRIEVGFFGLLSARLVTLPYALYISHHHQGNRSYLIICGAVVLSFDEIFYNHHGVYRHSRSVLRKQQRPHRRFEESYSCRGCGSVRSYVVKSVQFFSPSQLP